MQILLKRISDLVKAVQREYYEDGFHEQPGESLACDVHGNVITQTES